MLAGVAFFLLAMNFIESTLRRLAGRRFKLFLKKQTDNRVKAIGGAAVVTGLLQSSSIVNLLVLSMVGAHVLQMENALALILGANLGTTLDSWIVATLGFNFNIENVVFPIAGITGICMAFMNSESKWFLWLKFFFSLAFLFIALGFIKSGMEAYVKQTDLSFFNHYPVIVFLLMGILLTTIIQSSSATIALTLSALYLNTITLYAATAIVLGSEIGTTFKLFLASADGMAAKKRVALGNFIFNLTTVVIVFIFLRTVNELITDLLQVKNNLIPLVLFQSLVNLVSVILFFPGLKMLSKLLVKLFPEKEERSMYIDKVPAKETEFALDALENETKYFINLIMNYCLDSFGQLKKNRSYLLLHKNFNNKTIAEKYSFIKQLHGELHGYYLKVQNAASKKEETMRLDKLISAIRNMMYAAKNISDTQHDIEQVSNSSNDAKYSFYVQAGEKIMRFYDRIEVLVNRPDGVNQYEEITALYSSVTKGYSETLHKLYKAGLASNLSEIEITTLINFNRELYTSFKSVLFGLKDFRLSSKDAEYFDSLPGFIR